jgi:hypothetical protein
MVFLITSFTDSTLCPRTGAACNLGVGILEPAVDNYGRWQGRTGTKLLELAPSQGSSAPLRRCRPAAMGGVGLGREGPDPTSRSIFCFSFLHILSIFSSIFCMIVHLIRDGTEQIYMSLLTFCLNLNDA